MDEIQKALKERYSHVHPLIYHRSLEKVKSNVELFDLLDGLPDPPFIWDEHGRNWIHVDDIIQKESIHIAVEKASQIEEDEKDKEND